MTKRTVHKRQMAQMVGMVVAAAPANQGTPSTRLTTQALIDAIQHPPLSVVRKAYNSAIEIPARMSRADPSAWRYSAHWRTGSLVERGVLAHRQVRLRVDSIESHIFGDATYFPGVYETRVSSRFVAAAHPFGFEVLSLKDLT
jgi:hypothetical protein